MLVIIFLKALRNLFLPEIMKWFLVCLIAYAIGWLGLSWVFSMLINAYVHVAGGEGWIISALSAGGGIVIAWFMFPLLFPILVSFFDEKMVAVIEREDYPQLPAAQPPFWPTLANDVMFSLKALGLNVLCLPFYLMPPGVILYYGLNGYLLGTQFFRMAAGKRVGAAEAADIQKRARFSIIPAGIAISFCATIPVLNLVAPLLGVAVMVHLFHAYKR